VQILHYYAKLADKLYASFLGGSLNYNQNKALLGILEPGELPEGSKIYGEKKPQKQIPLLRIGVIRSRQDGSKYMGHVFVYCSAGKIENLFVKYKELKFPNCTVTSCEYAKSRTRL
jgi:hypothetical protein